jgi:hypothetical protein
MSLRSNPRVTESTGAASATDRIAGRRLVHTQAADLGSTRRSTIMVQYVSGNLKCI